MSQQGAEDWWQKLYDDADAGGEPDPGDTLDQRFRSAATLMTGPAPDVPSARRAPEPDPPWPPAPPGRVPSARPSPDTPPPRPTAAGRPPAAGAPARDATPAPTVPSAPAFDGPPAPAVPPPADGLPVRDPASALGGPGVPGVPSAADGAPSRRAGGEPPRAQVPPPSVGSGMPARPVPGEPAAPPPGVAPPVVQPGQPGRSDPRVVGETGYARGDVVVPPVEGADARRWPPPPPGPGRVREAADADESGAPEAPEAPEAPDTPESPYGPRPAVRHLGDRAPTYAPEPGALPAADPAALDFLTPDTVLEGARYGTYTLRAASLRGDSARFRGEARRDLLLTARFGGGDDGLVLVVLAGGDRAAPGAREAAAELGHSVAAAVGRSRERLADDIRAGRREALLSGLQRLTDRGYGRLRARAAELGLAEEAYTAGLRGLLLPLDPACRNRVCFGAGAGGLFRLRAGRWQDLEPDGPTPGAFRFRAAVARPGDTLLLCSGGLADPMREEGLLADALAARWSQAEPPGLAAFLADTQLRLKGYADDRTAAAVWEA
ncbi:protein phosphatase 2C domain-containing protein [Streptomyces lavendulae]|uniref:protein phosphatase 2C domain-containing protein n=1 Tax=Streptomyces lavendulae TaxID=1914 RepID=UPI0025550902|nr:protein phosphatase 2C domain-containing protein [Streptomyces lavendulae]